MAGGKVREPKEATTLPEKDYQDLRSTIQYLAGIHGVETMWGLFGWLATELDWNSLTRWEVGETILTGLKLANGSKVDDYVASYEHYLECDNVSSALGFNRVSFYAISEGWTSGEENKKDHSLYIIVKNGVLEAAENAGAPMKPLPLQAFFDSVPKDHREKLPVEQMTADFQFDGHAYRAIFTDVHLKRRRSEHVGVRECSFLLLEK